MSDPWATDSPLALAFRPTTLDLHGLGDLVDPGVDRGDSLLEREVHERTSPCGREVGPPVLMRDNYARPGPFDPSERTGIISTSRKDCLRSNPKFEQCGTAFRGDQVTEQQGVDDGWPHGPFVAGHSDAHISYKSSLREETPAAIAAGAVPQLQELHDVQGSPTIGRGRTPWWFGPKPA